MPTGVLNVSASASPGLGSSAQEKCSRHKRKFRTDHQSSLASPIPGISYGDTNGHVDGRIWSTMDCGSFCGGDVSPGSVDSTAYCSTQPHNLSQNDQNYVKSFIPENIRFPNYGTSAGFVGLHQSPYGKEDLGYEELGEPNWDNCAEAQLEEILMNMLDVLYKEAMKRIMSCDYGQEDALDAVLRNGRWNGGDSIASIVETSLTWLRTSEAGGESREPTFSDLKEMESYVLEEMVCMLRKARPFLSKGDAMWSLLMCEMNVPLACATEDSAVPSSSIMDRTSPPVVSSHFKEVFSPSSSTLSATSVPLPLQILCPSQVPVKPLTALANSYKDNRSAFSFSSFSSSPVGKIAAAYKNRGNPEKPCISSSAHTPPDVFNRKFGNLILEQEMQTVNNLSSDQLPLVMVPTLEEQITKLGLCLPDCGQSLNESHNLMPDHLSSDVNTAETCSIHSREKVRPPHLGTQGMPQPHDSTIRSSLSWHSPSEAAPPLPDSTVSRLRFKENCAPITQLPRDGREPVQTDLQTGDTNVFSGLESSQREASMDSEASDNVNMLACTATEVILATTSTAASESTEVSSNLQIENCIKESSVNNANSIHGISGLTDVNKEEKRTEILLQLVDRAKDLETQLQDWTEWAQQKVMPVARRLKKDVAELKALRLEREEYVRLRKEKQALEESTMKKLSEMENALCKALGQVDCANTTAQRLKLKNTEVRAEMEAAKLTAVESVSVCEEATNREKTYMKNARLWEKQKMKLQDELAEEKRKLTSLLQQQSQTIQWQQQAEERWRREETAKEEALMRLESEKRTKQQVESSSKMKEDEWRKKTERESQNHRDDIQQLECEIARVKMSAGLQSSMMTWEIGFGIPPNCMNTYTAAKLKQMNARLLSEIADLQDSPRDPNHDRACAMCMNEEMSVVFLPCAHQVICSKCNDKHEKQGFRNCPSCKTPIQSRISVYGVEI